MKIKKLKQDKKGLEFSGIVFMIFIASFILVTWTFFLDDIETNYVDTNISSISRLNQNLTNTTVSSQELNDTFSNTRQKIGEISKSEGSYRQFAQGAVAIPTFFIDFLASLPTFSNLAIKQITAFTIFLGIPTAIVTYFVIGITLVLVFIFIAQARRYRV